MGEQRWTPGGWSTIEYARAGVASQREDPPPPGEVPGATSENDRSPGGAVLDDDGFVPPEPVADSLSVDWHDPDSGVRSDHDRPRLASASYDSAPPPSASPGVGDRHPPSFGAAPPPDGSTAAADVVRHSTATPAASLPADSRREAPPPADVPWPSTDGPAAHPTAPTAVGPAHTLDRAGPEANDGSWGWDAASPAEGAFAQPADSTTVGVPAAPSPPDPPHRALDRAVPEPGRRSAPWGDAPPPGDDPTGGPGGAGKSPVAPSSPAEMAQRTGPAASVEQGDGPATSTSSATTTAPDLPLGTTAGPDAAPLATRQDDRPIAAAAAGSSPSGSRVSDVVRPLPRFMAVANQKGGVGKTTTAVNLGAALAELGYRVLVIDLDPQGNATTGLGINARNLSTSIYDVLLNDLPLEDCIEPTAVRNLFLAPATIDLAGAEIELVPAFSREMRLRRAIERLGDDYDYTLIDCPPSLGLLTVNGLAAANEVVVPIQCEYYALEGLGQLLRNVKLVQNNLNPTLELGAIILTMYDARTKLSDQVAKDVRLHFGAKVCRNIVPRTIRLSEAPSFGQPIIVFDSTSRGAIAYRELAKEVSGGAPRRAG